MKAIVIGAGVIGVMNAYYLSQCGVQVTVIEREAEPALITSYGNGGYLQASITDPFNGPGAIGIFAQAWINGLFGRGDESAFNTRTSALPGLVGWGIQFLKNTSLKTYLSHTVKNRVLAHYSVGLTKDIIDQESLEVSHSDRGALIVFRNKKSLQSYTEVAKAVAEHGANFEALNQQGLLAREPSLEAVIEQMAGAVFLPEDFAANSHLFCKQITELLIERGVEFQFSSEVQEIVSEDNGVRVLCESSDFGSNELGSNDFSADTLIIAAGNQSKPLAKFIGVKLPIAPIKGYSLSVPMNGWDNRPRHPIVDMDKHAGINPLGDVLRVAGTAELAGLQPGISQRRIQYLIDLAGELFPEFAERIDPNDTNIDPWGGHRPISPDGLPMIGPTRHKGIYINSGHGGMGWSQAAGSAKALVDTITGNTPDISINDFSIARFN